MSTPTLNIPNANSPNLSPPETIAATPPLTYRFGEFELDTESFELRRRGELVPLQPQPSRVLAYFLENPHRPVSRNDLRDAIWGGDTYLDHKQAVNYAVRKIRIALDDDAETPRYLETLPRIGYRFLGRVEKHRPVWDDAPVVAPAKASSEAPAAEPAEPGVASSPAGDEPAAPAVAPPPVASRVEPRRRPAWQWGLLGAVLALSWMPWVWSRGPLQSWAEPGVGGGAGATSDAVGRGDVRVASSQAISRLVVLPLAAEEDEEPLSQVVTEELIAQLTRRFPGQLSIVTLSRGSAGTGPTQEGIGAGLGADFLLKGSIQRIDGRISLSLRLCQVRNQVHLWADLDKISMSDLALWYRRVVDQLGQELELQASPAEEPSLQAMDGELYDVYVQGRYLIAQPRHADIALGVEKLEHVVAQAPSSAEAHAALAEGYLNIGWGSPYMDSLPRVRRFAERALELKPGLPKAHNMAAIAYLLLDHDPEAARVEIQRALAQPDHTADDWHFYGLVLSAMGRHDGAIDAIRRAMEMNPSSLFLTSDLAFCLAYAGRLEEALGAVERSLEVSKDNRFDAFLRVTLLHLLEGPEASFPAFQEFLAPLDLPSYGTLEEAVDGYLALLEERFSGKARILRAKLHLLLDREEPAMAALEGECTDGKDRELAFAHVDPMFAPLRLRPDYMARVGHCLLPPV